MAWYNFNSNRKQLEITSETSEKVEKKSNKYAFSTPFFKLGKGNDLTRPYVNSQAMYNGYIPHAFNNLLPNILEQAYYSSVYNKKAIDFTVAAVLGNGYEIRNIELLSPMERLIIETFFKRIRFSLLLDRLMFNYKVHEAIFVEIDLSDKEYPLMRVIDGGQVRLNKNKTTATIIPDVTIQTNKYTLPIHYYGMKETRFLYVFQDYKFENGVYNFPSYLSVMNDIFNETDISFMRKEAIKNGSFPTTVLSLPYEIENDEQKEEIENTIYSEKGPQTINKWLVFSANGSDNLPKIDTISISQGLDGLFKVTEDQIEQRIYKAHGIQDALSGNQTAGSLGNNQQLETEADIFTETVVIPMRRKLENELNRMLDIIFPTMGVSIDILNKKKTDVI